MEVHSNRKRVRIVILGIAIAFILLGVVRKEHLTVLNKAVGICLECIGIS